MHVRLASPERTNVGWTSDLDCALTIPASQTTSDYSQYDPYHLILQKSALRMGAKFDWIGQVVVYVKERVIGKLNSIKL